MRFMGTSPWDGSRALPKALGSPSIVFGRTDGGKRDGAHQSGWHPHVAGGARPRYVPASHRFPPAPGCSSELNPRIWRNAAPIVAGLCVVPGLCAVLGLCVALGPWAATTLSAQQPTPVPGEVSCAECVITLDTVATLGTWDDSGIPVITPFSRVAVDHRGRFLITHLTYPAISVFAPDGEFLGIVGRGADRAGGPGNRRGAGRDRPVEFDAIAHVNVGPRFIHAFDFRRGRMVLDQGFDLVRTDPSLGQVLSSVVLDADQVAFAVPAAAPATVGHQLHILDLGGHTAHFGSDPPPDQGPQPQRFLVTGDDRNVWSSASRPTGWCAGTWSPRRRSPASSTAPSSPSRVTTRPPRPGQGPSMSAACSTKTGCGSRGRLPTPNGRSGSAPVGRSPKRRGKRSWMGGWT